MVKTGRTAEAEMLHARDMIQVEDVSDGALPQTTDDDNATVQGAQKYQQAHCLANIVWQTFPLSLILFQV